MKWLLQEAKLDSNSWSLNTGCGGGKTSERRRDRKKQKEREQDKGSFHHALTHPILIIFSRREREQSTRHHESSSARTHPLYCQWLQVASCNCYSLLFLYASSASISLLFCGGGKGGMRMPSHQIKNILATLTSCQV